MKKQKENKLQMLISVSGKSAQYITDTFYSYIIIVY